MLKLLHLSYEMAVTSSNFKKSALIENWRDKKGFTLSYIVFLPLVDL